MQHYKGIKLLNSVKLCMKDGEFNKQVQNAIDNYINVLEETGYKQIGAYKKSNEPVKLACPNGHRFEATPNNFATKQSRCPECFNENRPTFKNKFDNSLERRGWYLAEKYIDPKTKIKMFCNNDHENYRTPRGWMDNGTCTQCFHEKVFGKSSFDNF